MPHRPPCLAAVLAAVLGLAGPVARAQVPSWSARLGLASDLLVRGVRLSDGHAAVRSAAVDLYAAGWTLGLGALRLRDALGEPSRGWSLHLGHELALDQRWLLFADLEHSRYEGGAWLAGYGGRQFGLGLGYDDRWSLSWNVDQPLDPALAARSLDVNLRWPLARPLALGLGLGRTLGTAGGGRDYGQAGLELHAGGARLTLDRHWLRLPALPPYGERAARRWVGSAQWSF